MDEEHVAKLRERINATLERYPSPAPYFYNLIDEVFAQLEQAKAELAAEKKFSLEAVEQQMDDHKADIRLQNKLHANKIADLRKELAKYNE